MTKQEKPKCHRKYHFFALLAANILLIGFVVKETIPGLKEIPWIGVLTAVAAIMSSVISKRVREKILDILRSRIVSNVLVIIDNNVRYFLSMTLLYIILIISLLGTSLIIRCIYLRFEYKTLIDRCLASASTCDDNLRRAFILQPWRIEAPLLIARKQQLMTASHQDTEFHQWVKDFCMHPDVKQAINNAYTYKTYRCCVISNGPPAVLQNPLLWYASMLPEAESTSETAYKKRSIEFLNASMDKLDADTASDAILLKLRMENEIGRNQIKQLEEQTRKMYGTQMGSHYYQEAMDTLATNALRNHQRDDALALYAQVLEIRIRAKTSANQVWLRRPNKLLLYHLFQFYRTPYQSGEMADYIRTLEESDQEFFTRFRSKLIENPRYSAFGASLNDAWLENTFLGPEWNSGNKETNIEKYLKHGWRF